MVTTQATPAITRRQIMGRLLRFGRPLLPVLGASTFFRIVQMLLGIALFAIGAWGVAAVVTEGAEAPVGRILLVMVVIAFSKGLIRYFEQFLGHYVAFSLLAMLRGYFYDQIEPQAPAGVESRRTGDLLARVTKDIDRVEVFYAHTLAPAISAAVVPVVVLGYLAVAINPLVALTLLPFLVAVGIVTPLLSNRAATAAATDLRVTRGDISQHLSDSVQGVREVLAFGHVEERGEQLARLGGSATRAIRGIAVPAALRRGGNELLVALGMVSVLLVAGSLFRDGTITFSQLAVTLAVTLLSFGPVLGVEEFMVDLEQAFAGARRIWEVTDAPPVVSDPTDPVPVPDEASVAFENVTFTYRPDDPSVPAAVRDVSLQVSAGSRVAVVGTSGSGKSTLVSLLLRFWDPQSGRVLLGGQDVRASRLDDIRARVAVVSQRTYLFNDTVAANLRLARPDATQAELEHACRRAALHDTIAAMPDGYDSVVGEMGERLSGGQRQRLAIARALLADAPVLVLDEATSSLDAGTEAQIQGQLDDVARGRTVVTVAHRLHTIVDADQILVMEAGSVVERGRHAELLAAGGAYARLWERQLGDLDAEPAVAAP